MRFRIPLFVSGRSLVTRRGASPQSRSFLSDHKVSDEKDVYVAPTDPGSILARATENDDRIILVAAAGGGIQAAAWTARVLTGLVRDLRRETAGSIYSVAKTAERGFWWQRRDYVFRDGLQA